MDEIVIRLINILQDRFEVPLKTNGANILMNFSDIEQSVSEIWEKSDNWNSEQLFQAIDEVDIPNFTSSSRQQMYILVRR